VFEGGRTDRQTDRQFLEVRPVLGERGRKAGGGGGGGSGGGGGGGLVEIMVVGWLPNLLEGSH
jgi:hypothetical protein